ncbi:hypothetical protein KEM55_000938 [Ascosphaera atra]|nr:hypothetical protein KEM55_000938 [Ascosphaera atra]
MAPPPVTTAILPPPGPGLIRPTEADPNPASNPQIFNDAMVVRTVVFVGEQHCSIEHEMDDDDAKSWHFVFYSNDATNDKQQVPIGVLRLVPPPHEPHHDVTSAAFTEPARPYVKLGRLALTKEFRGLGLGKVMINAALEWLGSHAKEITASLQRSKGDETLSGRYTSGRSNSKRVGGWA